MLCGVGDGVSTRAGVTSNDSAAAKCNPMRVNQAAPSCESCEWYVVSSRYNTYMYDYATRARGLFQAVE